MQVLIADDDPVTRRLLQNYLQKWGYEVAAAADGLAAWALFEQGAFPIVITDWMMPGLDGPDLIRRVRAGSPSGYVYAILVTARSQKEDLVEGMDAGADDFLTKPFDRDELRVRIRAGERVVQLEQHLREARDALAQLGRLADLGRLAADVVHDVALSAADAAREPSLLGPDLLASLRRLEPQPAEGAESPGQEPDLHSLRETIARLCDRLTTDLRQVYESVRHRRDAAGGGTD